MSQPPVLGECHLFRMTMMSRLISWYTSTRFLFLHRLAPIDKIQTRMGAYDNMFTSSSTFKVELDECSKILKEAGPKSLIILDGEPQPSTRRLRMFGSGADLGLFVRTRTRNVYLRWYGNRRIRVASLCDSHTAAGLLCCECRLHNQLLSDRPTADHAKLPTVPQTHYGLLTDDLAYHPNVRNMHMQTHVDEEKREVSELMPEAFWRQIC